VSFDYTDEYKAQHPQAGDQRNYSVIAQEYTEVFPDYVKPMKGMLPDGGDALSVDLHPLYIYSVAAVQELHELVKTQQAEIEGLQSRVAAMEHALSANAQPAHPASPASIGALAIPALALLGFVGLIVRGRVHAFAPRINRDATDRVIVRGRAQNGGGR
jgi:hypothetical protein